MIKIAPVDLTALENIVNQILDSTELNWTFLQHETESPSEEKLKYLEKCKTKWARSPVFTHTLIKRGNREVKIGTDDCQHLSVFKVVFDRWMKAQGLVYDKLYRAAINVSMHNLADHCEPHVDHLWPHYNWIWYLDTVDAPTVLFDEELNIEHRIPCVKNTAVTFDGRMHAQSYPPPGVLRRAVVFTYGVPD
jgi:hypothetical protein